MQLGQELGPQKAGRQCPKSSKKQGVGGRRPEFSAPQGAKHTVLGTDGRGTGHVPVALQIPAPAGETGDGDSVACAGIGQDLCRSTSRSGRRWGDRGRVHLVAPPCDVGRLLTRSCLQAASRLRILKNQEGHGVAAGDPELARIYDILLR